MQKNVSKLLAMLMALVTVLCLTACGGNPSGPGNSGGFPSHNGGSGHSAQAGTVAQPLDLDTLFAAPANGVQDFHYWTNKEFPYESNPQRDQNPQVHYYMLDIQAMYEYADMLQKNGFTLVSFYDEFANCIEWALTSDRCPTAATITSVFDKSQCHVAIRYDGSNRKFRVDVSPDLRVCDLGLRRNGTVADVRPQGASAGAGLVRLADGSYQTSDGRLTAPVGTATVLRDGTEYNTTASFSIEKDCAAGKFCVQHDLKEPLH